MHSDETTNAMNAINATKSTDIDFCEPPATAVRGLKGQSSLAQPNGLGILHTVRGLKGRAIHDMIQRGPSGRNCSATFNPARWAGLRKIDPSGRSINVAVGWRVFGTNHG